MSYWVSFSNNYLRKWRDRIIFVAELNEHVYRSGCCVTLMLVILSSFVTNAAKTINWWDRENLILKRPKTFLKFSWTVINNLKKKCTIKNGVHVAEMKMLDRRKLKSAKRGRAKRNSTSIVQWCRAPLLRGMAIRLLKMIIPLNLILKWNSVSLTRQWHDLISMHAAFNISTQLVKRHRASPNSWRLLQQQNRRIPQMTNARALESVQHVIIKI